MAFNISEFAASGLPLGGARASLFNVLVQTPNGIPNVAAKLSFTCTAASLPGSDLNVQQVRYFGRNINIPGTRIFAPWTITMLNDEDFTVRNAFEAWSNAINSHEGNLRSPNMLTLEALKSTATITQYSKTGAPIRTYEMVNLFPSVIGPIDMSWENDNIETYQIELQYDFWRPSAPGTTGSFSVA